MTTIQNLAPKINIKTLYKHVRILKINGFLEYGAKVGKEKNYYVTDAGVTIAMQFSKQ